MAAQPATPATWASWAGAASEWIGFGPVAPGFRIRLAEDLDVVDTIPNAARPRYQVLVVDDHPVILDGLRILIDRNEQLQVCAVASTPEDARRAIDTMTPDIVVADIDLGEFSGLDLIRDLAGRSPPIPVVVLSIHDDMPNTKAAFGAGASGYVSKREATRILIDALLHVLRGEQYWGGRVAERLIQRESDRGPSPAAARIDDLTPRELEVFEMVGKCLSNREIASSLAVKVRTITTHRENIKRKLRLRSSSELVVRAARWVDTHDQ